MVWFLDPVRKCTSNCRRSEWGSGRGLLIPHSRSFFTRIPHSAQFFVTIPSSVFSQKNALKSLISTKANKCKMQIAPFNLYFEFTLAFKGTCKKKKTFCISVCQGKGPGERLSPYDNGARYGDCDLRVSAPRPLLLAISANPVKISKCFTMLNRSLGSSLLRQTLNFSLWIAEVLAPALIPSDSCN